MSGPRAAPNSSSGSGSSSVSALDVNRVARQVTGGSGLVEASSLQIRQGQVKFSDYAAQTVGITLGGSDVVIHDVPFSSNYRPLLDDYVTVFSFGNSLLVYDRVGLSGPAALSYYSTSWVLDEESRSSTSWGDLASPGPSVTTSISPSGKALVGASCEIALTTSFEAARIGWAVSGATSRSPGSNEEAMLYPNGIHTGGTLSLVRLVAGLSTGNTTFTLKYRTVFGESVLFKNRTLWMLPL